MTQGRRRESCMLSGDGEDRFIEVAVVGVAIFAKKVVQPVML